MSISPRGRLPRLDLSYSSGLVTETSSIDQSLLTPPLTPHSEKDIPFKPADSDAVSLSMKRAHKGGRRRSQRLRSTRGSASTSDAVDMWDKKSIMEESFPTRSNSMPVLCAQPLATVAFTSTAQSPFSKTCARRLSVPTRSRRWTLPCKSAPTRGLTTLKSVVKLHEVTNIKDREPSPAMITLRRARSKPARHTNLTFFPPPTFSRSKSSFMSQFLKSIAGEDQNNTENIDYFTNEVRKDANEQAPVMMIGASRPAITIMAGPMLTEVLPSVSFASTDDIIPPRRCSTRYTSSTSTYEVIWDGDDTLSSPSENSPPRSVTYETASVDQGPHDRRASAAVDKLEMQLAGAVAESRRASQADRHTSRRSSFPGMINFSFSRFINEAALKNLPRSRSSRGFRSTRSSSTLSGTAMHHTIEEACPVPSSGDAEYFPPLQSTCSTNMSSDLLEQVLRRSSTQISTSPVVGRARMGSLLGCSSHVRRKSVFPHTITDQANGKTKTARTRSAGCSITHGSRETVETKPLLAGYGWDEENPWRSR